MNKKEKIKELTEQLLQESYNAMKGKIDKAINSGALDIDDWDEKINPMVLPKSIATAILADETDVYSAKGTSFEKEIKENVKNLKYFI